MMKYSIPLPALALALILFPAAGLLAAASEYLIGPTGISGDISKKGIKVTQVAAGSPAEGKIKKGDEIIGMGGGPFKGDVRKAVAAAIDAAETQKAGGELNVILKGNKPVALQLEVLGTYSETAPFNCPKSEKIIERAAAYLEEKVHESMDPKNKRSKGRFNTGATHTALLGLMATGEKKYIDLVANVIKGSELANPNVQRIEDWFNGGQDMGYVGWYWGYNCIVLGEYHLLTGDDSVLPALKTYSVSLARGQDAGGLWGHRMAKNGRLPGYAQMNQSSLSCYMGMLFAKKCGIKDPLLEKGLEKTSKYYATHVGQGGFNYGVHGPNQKAFNNNGMSGSATMCMALEDNKEGVRFFSRMCSTSHGSLEQGHASSFFNPLWTPLAANFSGPEVTQQFFENASWFFTPNRNWDGSFYRGGKEAGKEGSMTGLALLTYCLPRKALIITGREADESLWLRGKDATAAVDMSNTDFKKLSIDELLALCDHPLPMMRTPAVWSLRERDGTKFIPALLKMMDSGTKLEKISAMEYFGYKCPPEQAHPQIERIGAILRDKNEDLELRAKAASVLSFQGEAAYGYYKDMLQLVVDEEPGDHFRDTDQSVGRSLNFLCSTPHGSGLVTDKKLFYAAVHKLLDHKRQNGRADGVKMLSDMPIEDFPQVAEKLFYIIEDKDRTYHSYHAWQSTIGPAIEILAGLNIKEGLPYASGILDREGGKWGFKVRMLCASLPKYGGHAKEALAKIKTDERLNGIEKSRFGGMWRNMVKAIDEDPSPKPLISIEEALEIGRQ